MKVYLDNNATTPLDPEAVEASLPFWAKTLATQTRFTLTEVRLTRLCNAVWNSFTQASEREMRMMLS